jgi:hypothetical protein
VADTLFQGNSRLQRIARWLRDSARGAQCHELVLEASPPGEPAQVLARWPKDAADPELARVVDELLQDMANDRQATVTGALQWRTAEDRVWTAKPFRASPTDDAMPREAAGAMPRMDGSSLSIIQQLQRSLEVKDRLILELFRSSEERFERVFSVMDRQLERLSERWHRAEETAEELAEEASQARAIAADATTVAETAIAESERVAAEAEKDDRLGKVVELLGKTVMQGAAGPAAAQGK